MRARGGGAGIRPPYNLIASLVAKRVKVVCASLPQDRCYTASPHGKGNLVVLYS